MEKEDYLFQLKILKEKHQKEIQHLQVQCAKANNDCNIGDIIEDHIGKIQVEEIRYGLTSSGSFPTCIYYGLCLKRDGTPKKDGSKRNAYQINLINY